MPQVLEPSCEVGLVVDCRAGTTHFVQTLRSPIDAARCKAREIIRESPRDGSKPTVKKGGKIPAVRLNLRSGTFQGWSARIQPASAWLRAVGLGKPMRSHTDAPDLASLRCGLNFCIMACDYQRAGVRETRPRDIDSIPRSHVFIEYFAVPHAIFRRRLY
jgi:hypothetical protein